MASRALIATIVLLVGFGIGYVTPMWLARSAESGVVAVSDSEHEVSAALAEFKRLDRVAALASLLSRIPPEGLAGVLAAFKTAPLSGGDIEYLLLVSWWARFAPEAAHHWAQRDLRVGGWGPILAELLRTWARQDPESALAAARELRFPLQRRHGMAAVLLAVGTSDAHRILELLQMLPAGPDRQAAIAALVSRSTAAGDPETTKRRMEDLARMAREEADSGLTEEISSASLIALASGDPKGAAQWWSDWIGLDGRVSEAVAEKIGVEWAKRDPTAAMAWIATLPPSQARDDVMRQSYRQWTSQDHRAAFAWIATHIEAPERWLEPAVGAYAITVGAKEPRDGLAIAQNLSDERILREAMMRIVRRWLTTDRPAALAWIEAADLPPDQAARLLSRAPPRRPARLQPPST